MAFVIPLVYLCLLALAIPWYWPANNHNLLFGLPLWVVIAVIVSIATSCLTAILLSKPWPGESAKDDE